MTELRATFHFRVKGLMIESDLLATSHELVSGPQRIVLTFPSTAPPEDEPLDDELIAKVFPAEEPSPREIGGFARGSARLSGSGNLARVDVIRVSVYFSAEVGAADFEDEERMDWTPVQRSASQLLWDALPDAGRAASQFLDWVRVVGYQPWLGLSTSEPEAIGHAQLVDMDAFTRIPVTVSTTPLVVRQIDSSQVLSESSIRQLVEAARRGQPGLAASLLSDAAYYAWEAGPPDPSRAILIAAIACEVRVKDALRAGVDGVSAALVDLLLDNPRDWSMAAAALWDKPLLAVYGHSLREDEPDAYKGVNRLFGRRNKIAHHGETFPSEVAVESVQATSAAFRWLHAISSEAKSAESTP